MLRDIPKSNWDLIIQISYCSHTICITVTTFVYIHSRNVHCVTL